MLHNKFKVYKGGADKMEAIIKNNAMSISSAKSIKEPKTDLEYLVEWGNAAAKEKGLTEERSKILLKAARDLIRENSY
ncbi:MAG: hypothetical protein N3I35_06760 [Clostridia bacterium]|nr:hypothetical protein [Clostridia bacterium]